MANGREGRERNAANSEGPDDSPEAQCLRLALDAAGMGWWQWDLVTGTLTGDDRCKSLLWLRLEEESSYEQFLTMVHPEDRACVEADVSQAKANPGEYQSEFRVVGPDGSMRWILSKGRSLTEGSDRPNRMMGVALDVTQRKQAEQERADLMRRWQAENRHLQAVLDQMPSGVVVAEAPSGRLLFSNSLIRQMFGGTHRGSQSIGEYDQWHPSHTDGRPFDPNDMPMARAMRGETVAAEEMMFPRPNAEWLIVSVNAAPIRDYQGIIIAGVITVLDITERKSAEAEIRSIAAFPEENPSPVLRASGDSRILYTNHPAQRLLTAIGCTEESPLPPELSEAVGRVLATGEKCEVELVCGEDRVFLFTLSPSATEGWVNVYGQEITTRKQAEQALHAAKAATEQASRAKDRFLAVLSHELRTPLTPVVMGVTMLQDRTDLDPTMRETLEMIRRNVEMEARLIDDLLDVTRIARGKLELDRKLVELSTVIQRAVEVCKPDIEARGLHFGVDWGPAAPYWVEADVARLQQVFWNLLKNAIKFTPHGGCVGIRCRPHDGHVSLEVNDSGIGIEPLAIPRLFNDFEQVERSITRHFGGLGLGLAISKAIVEMHGGEIEAYSKGLDKGATFRIRLPLVAPAGQAEPPLPTTPHRVVRPLRILQVEDHGVTAKMIGMVLTADGHQVETAGDVATALEVAAQHDFDLLISDLGLPDGSGHDLLRQLHDRGHQFPAIALSGFGQEEDIQRSREAGFAAHLTKPTSREALLTSVAAVTAVHAP